MTKAAYDKQIKAGKEKIKGLEEDQEKLREAKRALIKEKDAFKNTSYKDNRTVTSVVHWQGYYADKFKTNAQDLLKDEDSYKLKFLSNHIKLIEAKLKKLKEEQRSAEKHVRSLQQARSREYPYG